MTETDTPTFGLRGLYAANARGTLTRHRTRTMSYLISDFSRGNSEVQALMGQQVEKRYPYSFMGRSNSWARKHIFRTLQSSAGSVIEATHSSPGTPSARRGMPTLSTCTPDIVFSDSPVRESAMAAISIVRAKAREAYWVVCRWVKKMVLLGYRLTGQPFPYKLYEPTE